MTIVNKLEPIFLLIGDIVIFYIALWLTLFVRYFEIPTFEVWNNHALPFSILFFVWIIFFYISGLYEKHTVLFRKKLPSIILNTQIINSIFAFIFFYLIPYFSIAPKTNLFMHLVVSFVLILIWRLFIFSTTFFNRQKDRAIIIGVGDEVDELFNEVNNNYRYGFKFIKIINPNNIEEDIVDLIKKENISIVAIDIRNEKIQPILPKMYNLIFYNVQFIDNYKMYEDIFDRIPLSATNYNWFLENISSQSYIFYDFFKRLMDIFVSAILAVISIIFYPFVVIAIFIESRSAPIITQIRIGKGNEKIYLYKFKTMKYSDSGGQWPGQEGNKNYVTKVGHFLRKTRIDELPQLWNVLKGDISLIGPRPDIDGNFDLLSEHIPYYSTRNIVKPGLSGWAQISQDIPPHSIEETKIRLAYDLYYIKNRSFLLDIKIALRTIKTLISRTGK